MMGLWLLALALGSRELAAPRMVDAPRAPRDLRWQAGYADLVADLARLAPRGAVPTDAAARAEALGLDLVVEGPRLWLLEPEGRAEGLGILALRLGPLPAEWVVQAPHPRADLHTGRIAAALFDEGAARGLQLATSHRARGTDAAHDPEGPLQDATAALARALPDLLVVQLHGFGAQTTEADAVVSPGPGRAPPGACTLARLAPALGPDLRGPEEVPALAGRSNAQGLLLLDLARFLHVELSLAAREALAEDASRRAALHDALADEARRAPCAGEAP